MVDILQWNDNITAMRMKKGYHIFSLLFSIYFSVFAVSPLTYTYTCNDVAEQTDISIKNIRLFVIDMLLSSLAKKDNMGQGNDSRSQSSSCNILLKKKKTTLSSNKVEISSNVFKKIGPVTEAFTFLPEIFPAISALQDNKPVFQNGFHKSYSGLSPPSILSENTFHTVAQCRPANSLNNRCVG